MWQDLLAAVRRIRINTSFHIESIRLAVLRDFADLGMLMILIGPVWFSLAYPPELPQIVRRVRAAIATSVAAACVLAPYVLAFAAA